MSVKVAAGSRGHTQSGREFNKGTTCKGVGGRDTTRSGPAQGPARGQRVVELVTEVLSPALGLKQ